MDYLKLLHAAAVRDLAKARLNGDVPRDLRDEDRQQWKRERFDDYIIAAANEIKRVAALIDTADQSK